MFSQCKNLTINIIFIILELEYFTNSNPTTLEQELLFKVGTAYFLFSNTLYNRMFYWNTIEQLFLSVEQVDQLKDCLTL